MERVEYLRCLDDVPDPRRCQRAEPQRAHGAEQQADYAGALALDGEQCDQHARRNGNDIRLEHRRSELEALDRRQHRDRRREHGIAIEQCGAEHSEGQHRRCAAAGALGKLDSASASSAMMPPSPRLVARSTSTTYLSDTTIISDQKIAETPPRMFSGVSGIPCCGIEGFLRGVQGTGADVAVDDAEREERGQQGRASLFASCAQAYGMARSPIASPSRRDSLREFNARCATLRPMRASLGVAGLCVVGCGDRGVHARRLRDACALRPRQHRDGLRAGRGRDRAALSARAGRRHRDPVGARLRLRVRAAQRHATVDDMQYLLTFAIMVAVALVISRLVESVRRRAAAQAALELEAETERIRARCSPRSRTTCARRSRSWRRIVEPRRKRRAHERRRAPRACRKRVRAGAAHVRARRQDPADDAPRERRDRARPRLGVDGRDRRLGAPAPARAAGIAPRHRRGARELPLVRVDASLVEQALGNLLENARQPHARRTRSCACARAAQGRPRGDASRTTAAAWPTSTSRACSRSSITARGGQRGGVGLGLAICRAIVRLHGGQAWAERVPGGGTAFRFTLPLEAPPPMRRAIAHAMAPRPAVLVIEDEPEIRRFLRASLGVEGYRVIESATGRRGAIDAGTHKPDLAIVDLALPDMDGVEVIRRIREWSSMPDHRAVGARAGAIEDRGARCRRQRLRDEALRHRRAAGARARRAAPRRTRASPDRPCCAWATSSSTSARGPCIGTASRCT